LAKSNQHTVILCDWHMPELGGMNVVTCLETDAPESAAVIDQWLPFCGAGD